jgi:hypothetical protein
MNKRAELENAGYSMYQSVNLFYVLGLTVVGYFLPLISIIMALYCFYYSVYYIVLKTVWLYRYKSKSVYGSDKRYTSGYKVIGTKKVIDIYPTVFEADSDDISYYRLLSAILFTIMFLNILFVMYSI